MNEWQRKIKWNNSEPKKKNNFEKIIFQMDQIIYFSILFIYITKILVAYQND